MLLAPGNHAKTVLQGAQDVEVGDLHANGRQPRFVDQPVGDPIKPRLPAVLAEVVAARFVQGRRDESFRSQPLLPAHRRSPGWPPDTLNEGGLGLSSQRTTTN